MFALRGAVEFGADVDRAAALDRIAGAITIDPACPEARYEFHIDQLAVLALFMMAVIAVMNVPVWVALLLPLFMFIGVRIDLARSRRLLRRAANNVSS